MPYPLQVFEFVHVSRMALYPFPPDFAMAPHILQYNPLGCPDKVPTGKEADRCDTSLILCLFS